MAAAPSVPDYGAIEDGAPRVAKGGNGGASFWGTVANVAKICIGTGILALSYAFAHGGLLFSPVVLVAIAIWNDWSVGCLLACEARLPADAAQRLSRVSTYSRIAWAALGNTGIYLVEGMLMVTIFGVCTAYIIFSEQLLGASPLSLGSEAANALACALVVFLPSLSKDVSYLVPLSNIGLFVLMAVVCSMFYVGATGETHAENRAVDLLPASFRGFAVYFGVAVYCFGGTPLMFPVKESMEDQRAKSFRRAHQMALLLTSLAYCVVGVGLAVVFARTAGGVPANLLQVLPRESRLASVLRLSFLVVTLLTLPLNFVPLAQLVEGKVFRDGGSVAQTCALRLLLLAVVVAVAAAVPDFGLVVSLLGCFSVTVLSFVLPPLFMLRIKAKHGERTAAPLAKALIALGVVVCVATTAQTALSIYAKLARGSA